MFNILRRRVNRKGQATVEVVLLFPLFLILILFLARVFALLVLVQKLEIASVYVSKRWLLESHTNIDYAQGWDVNFLKKDIEKRVEDYIGFNNKATRDFLGLKAIKVDIQRTVYWNDITITVLTNPSKLGILCKYDKNTVCKGKIMQNCFKGYNYICESGGKLVVSKHVPNRDRPIPFVLPVVKKKNIKAK
ncbi:hypothetical protein Dip518_000415 [Parelusimicrobium proximum]|uniref:hypothetical protein n=1 Tax=Parelusimicrobium proximum TaxID=3228953 RepID=UPI003D1671A5